MEELAFRSLPAGSGFKPPSSEPLYRCRYCLPDIKTEGRNYPRDESIGYQLTGWMISGMEITRARFRRSSGTAGTRYCDAKGESQVKKSKTERTEAQAKDGPICSSGEAFVMSVERRSRTAAPVELLANSRWRMSL